MRNQLILLSSVVSLSFGCTSTSRDITDARSSNVVLSKWEQGLTVTARDDPTMYVSLWFYEWNMFGAVEPKQHTGGLWVNDVEVNEDATRGRIECLLGFELEAEVAESGVELTLRAKNISDHDWPDLAAIIPCFNPGPFRRQNPRFVNRNTYFLASDGLNPLYIEAPREIHFNERLRDAVDAEATDGLYVWSGKWPKSKVDAATGLIVRESDDGEWVCGIAWERFLSCQGHNPWNCMHLSVHLGPLDRGDSRRVRGKIYLMRGTKEDLLRTYSKDFRRS